jgi:hypothetical protein
MKKKKSQQHHASLRFLQRCGEQFTTRMNEAFCLKIRTATGATFIERQTNRVSVWDIDEGTKTYRCVYDKQRKQIVTVLQVVDHEIGTTQGVLPPQVKKPTDLDKIYDVNKFLAMVQTKYKDAYAIQDDVFIPLKFLRDTTSADMLALDGTGKLLEIYYIKHATSESFKSYVQWTRLYRKSLANVLSFIQDSINKVNEEWDAFEKECIELMEEFTGHEKTPDLP